AVGSRRHELDEVEVPGALPLERARGELAGVLVVVREVAPERDGHAVDRAARDSRLDAGPMVHRPILATLARNKMRKHRNARRAPREMLGLTKAEFAVLRRLDSPEKIHAFLFHLGQNFELDGKDTCNSVRTVLRLRRAHCIEGAMVAACAMWIHGEPPLLMDMQAVKDVDHVIAPYPPHRPLGASS